jgi:GNAT superfamily N-acetyltransferase
MRSRRRAEQIARLAATPANCRNHLASTRTGASYGGFRLKPFGENRLMTTYIHLRTEKPERREQLCRAFYEEIYREAFPKSDEAEDPGVWLPLMEQVARPGQPSVHIILAHDQTQRIVGGVVFELYRNSWCWLITYIAVQENMRRAGIGTGLLAEVRRVIAEQCKDQAMVLAECENPSRMTSCNDQLIAVTRARALRKLGMRRVPIAYVQPALRTDAQPVDRLLLLCHRAPGGADVIQTARLAQFLREFYEALGQSRSAHLDSMIKPLERSTTLPLEDLSEWTLLASQDDILGTADGIGLRMTFFQSNLGSGREGRPRSRSSELREVPLQALRGALEEEVDDKRLGDALSASVESFHSDIVTPYATESSLPLTVLCEPFADVGKGGFQLAHDVHIRIPHCFEMRWEQRRALPITFTDTDDPHIISAKMVDNVTFFESGYIAYSISFVFTGTINAAELLVLEAVAKPAGKIIGEHVRFSIGSDGPFEQLQNFIGRRLDLLHREASQRPTVFSLLKSKRLCKMGPRLCNSLLLAFPMKSPSAPGSDGLEVTNMVYVGIEIIGATTQERILDYADRALRREVPINRFSKRLAGLVQNVLDLDEQDLEEVNDSLSSAVRIGSDITFAHKDVTVRFSESSRAFSSMKSVVGGSPYLLLVQLVAGHNEKLLWDLHDQLDLVRSRSGIKGMMNELLRQIGIGEYSQC